MLNSGDWLNPRRNHEVGHWTKPPLTYWAIASSIAVFGANPWAARLPAALSYLLCIWLTWRIARRLSPGSEHAAALIYATMLFTVGASQLITTDYLLAACDAGDVGVRRGALRHRGGHATALDRADVGGLGAGVRHQGPAALMPLAGGAAVRLPDAGPPGAPHAAMVGHRAVRGAGAAVVPGGVPWQSGPVPATSSATSW